MLGVKGNTNKSVSGFRKTFKRVVNPQAKKQKIISTCYWTDLPGLLGVPCSNNFQTGACRKRIYFVPLINNIKK